MNTGTGYIVYGFGKRSEDGKFEKLKITRGETGPDDVEIVIHFCGIGISDALYMRNYLGNTYYPCVPGREITGRVRLVGANIDDLKEGDRVGVGSIVDSCLRCDECQRRRENACINGWTMAFNSLIAHNHLDTDRGYTLGGFSQKITVNRRFVIKIPHGYPLSAAAVLMNTGVTMYTPLKKYGADNGKKRIGVLGLGNLGVLGIKLARQMGNEVTAFSSHEDKKSMAYEVGAHKFIWLEDYEELNKVARTFDILLNTIVTDHQVSYFLPLLGFSGVIVQLGMYTKPHKVRQFPEIMFSNITIAGSMIGSIKDTQELVDYCYSHKIIPITEIVTADRLQEVFEDLEVDDKDFQRYCLDVRESFKIHDFDKALERHSSRDCGGHPMKSNAIGFEVHLS